MSDARPTYSHWTAARAARLGFLVGQGRDAGTVAKDPAIASTPTNVYRQATRFGLAFREADTMRLPPPVRARLDAAAGKRGLTRDGLIRTLLLAAGSDPTLIDNILDDDP